MILASPRSYPVGHVCPHCGSQAKQARGRIFVPHTDKCLRGKRIRRKFPALAAETQEIMKGLQDV